MTSHNKQEWYLNWAAAFLLVISMVALAFRYALPIRDSDIWWHMLYGKYFIENQTLIADHTIFSWSPSSNDIIYCTWLPDIFFYLLHKAAGLPGLFTFRYFCMSLLILSCFFYSRKLKIASHPFVWIICLTALLMSYTAAFIKPEIVSFSLMTLAVWNWWHIRSGGEKAWRHCYLFPVIMLVWVNSHGGFIFGTVFLILIGFGEILNTWFSHANCLSKQVRKHLSLSLLAAVVALFLTPYGYRYPYQILHDILPTQANVEYNQKIAAYIAPFTEVSSFHSFTLYANLAIVILILLYALNFKKRNIEWSSLLTNLAFAFLYTRFFRTTFFWAPVFMFSSIYLLSKSPSCLYEKFHPYVKQHAMPILTIVLGAWIAGSAIYQSATTPEPYQWMGFGISEANPVEEGRYIKRYFPKSRIGNTYDQGAYLLWLLWPENRVFFDSRHFPYKKWSDDFFSFEHGKNVLEFTEKYPADLWCISIRNLPGCMALYYSGNWKLIYYGKNAAIFARKKLLVPRNAETVSTDITNIKNLSSAVHLLAFLCAIKDWTTAENVLKAMEKKFKHGVPKEKANKALSFYEGVQSYNNRDYLTAYNKFIFAHPDPFNSKSYLINCLLFLSQKSWQQGDSQKALALNIQAWNLYGQNIYSAYNAGVIKWHEKTKSQTHNFLSETSSPPEWRHYLHFFLKHVPHSPQFENSIRVAREILAGSFAIKGKPRLIFPQEPKAPPDVSS